MLETKGLFAAGLTLTVLTTTGCYNFETAFDECVATRRCVPVGCAPGAVDLPDDAFQDTNCDGVDGTASAALFVDPTAGRDNNPGTREAPLKTLAHALQRASNEGKALYLAQGSYDEPALRLDKPVSLYGGYSGVSDRWGRGDYTTHINGGPVGLTVSGLGQDAGVVLERLRITSSTGVEPGTPSIGVRVLNSSGVLLRHVEVVAGEGAPGAPGHPPPANPQGGAEGGVGQSASASTAGARAKGGDPGVSSCGDVSYKGGRGGAGGNDINNAAAGEPGEPSTAGGTASPNEYPGCSTSSCVCNGKAGTKGQDGSEGGAGTNGNPGKGVGQLLGDTWAPTSGTAGGPGSPGGGGGGGGGGAYCSAIYIDSAKSEGGGGGGGGGGGCPGGGGGGGGGGGASIALLLLNGRVDLESVTLKTTGGGRGGAGGTGGPGGPGGKGGAGGTSYTHHIESSPPKTATGGAGGAGGNGGAGGRGGHGGNGGGGPSVGVWCDPTSSFSRKATVIELGPAGQPGNGPGPKDDEILRTESHQCPPAP